MIELMIVYVFIFILHCFYALWNEKDHDYDLTKAETYDIMETYNDE